MADATELFSFTSFATLQGGALAAILVPNTIDTYLKKLDRGWLNGIAFAISQLAAYACALAADGDGWKWLIAALNGFVIFSAAMGQNQAAFALVGNSGPVEPARGLGEDQEVRRWGIFRSWL